LIYHPGRNADQDEETRSEKTAKFKDISSAYETLKDGESRKRYDMEQRMGAGFSFGHSMSQSEDMQDINQLFSMLFSGGMPGQSMGQSMGPEIRIFHSPHMGSNMGQQMFMNMQRPPAIIRNVNITMEQCYNGFDMPIDIEKWVYHNGMRVTEIQTIHVHIPAGIQENEIIILRNCGNESSPEMKGDIKIGIKVNNSTPYIRMDMDLLYKKVITLKESLTGFLFEIVHLNGKVLALNNTTNPTIIKPHYKKVFNGLGMKREDGNVGNLILEFDVEFPDALSKEQMEQIKRVLSI